MTGPTEGVHCPIVFHILSFVLVSPFMISSILMITLLPLMEDARDRSVQSLSSLDDYRPRLAQTVARGILSGRIRPHFPLFNLKESHAVTFFFGGVFAALFGPLIISLFLLRG